MLQAHRINAGIRPSAFDDAIDHLFQQKAWGVIYYRQRHRRIHPNRGLLSGSWRFLIPMPTGTRCRRSFTRRWRLSRYELSSQSVSVRTAQKSQPLAVPEYRANQPPEAGLIRGQIFKVGRVRRRASVTGSRGCPSAPPRTGVPVNDSAFLSSPRAASVEANKIAGFVNEMIALVKE